MKGGFEFLEQLFFPARCVGCNLWYAYDTDAWWCQVCERERNISGCVIKTVRGFQAFGASSYSVRSVRRAIRLIKYRGAYQAMRCVGLWIVPEIERLREMYQDVIIVPVPLHPDRLRSRGFNQAELCARIAGQEAGVLVESLALARTVFHVAQATLSETERLSALSGVFVVPEKTIALVKGKTCIVVDDVITTGATFIACAEALIAAGAVNVVGVTIAGTIYQKQSQNRVV